MTLLLSHGYFIAEDVKEQKIMRPYPPLGLLYISSYLKQKGLFVDVFDTTFSSKNDFKKHVLVQKPTIIALYVNLMTKLNVLDLIQWIKSEKKLQNTKIILGGPDVTYNTLDYLQAGADFIVLGEGEQTCYELIYALQKSEIDFENIAGISYLNHEQIEVKTAPREKIKNIDTLPFPDRESIDLTKYIEVWKTHHGSGMISISTQRGCPYTCKWCSTAVYGQSYRRRSVENVLAELEFLIQKYQINTFWFVDDVFTVSHQWLRAFNDEIVKKGITIRYECISRADRMNEEVIQLLKSSGCFRIWIGAESGSQKIIDLMDRRVDVMQVREMIQQTKKHGIEAGTFIMLGYPGETKEDIEETIIHLKESLPTHFTITIAYPIKGTGLYNEVDSIQTVNLPWNQSTDRDRDFRRNYSKKYYQYAIRRVTHEVNFAKLKAKNKAFTYKGFKSFVYYQLAKSMMALYE